MPQATETLVLTDGTEIVIAIQGEMVVLSRPGFWELRLVREDAWQLAEALDELSTRAHPGDPDSIIR